MWLELLQCLWGVVDEGETSGLSTTKLCLETEDVDLVLAGLVELSELAAKLILGDVCAVWVQDVTVNGALVWFSLTMSFCPFASFFVRELELVPERRGELTRPSACDPTMGCE